MIGEPAVGGAQKPGNAGQFRHRIERQGPPDLAREIDDGASAAEDSAIRRSDTHFAEQLRERQIEKRLDARVLQSGQAEAARLERAAEAPGERRAHGAVAVEEDPAACSASDFYISYF